MPGGICLLSLGATSSTFPFTVRLQYDDGRGFGGGEDIVIFVERDEMLKKLIYLPKKIQGLRLAVFFGDSSVVIRSCAIREIGKIHRASSKAFSLAKKILKEPRLYLSYTKKAFRLYQQGGLGAPQGRRWRVGKRHRGHTLRRACGVGGYAVRRIGTGRQRLIGADRYGRMPGERNQ